MTTSKSPVARILPLLAVACLAGANATSPAWGWGMTGHAVVAEIAERRLPPELRQRLSQMLGGGSLASVSATADTLAALRPSQRRGHYVNIPFAAEHYDPARDCRPPAAAAAPPPSSPSLVASAPAVESAPACIVAALSNAMGELGNPRLPHATRKAALVQVAHLVADIHQPLHCIDRDDMGGNNVPVVYFEQPTNLHLLWDFGMLDKVSHDWGVHIAAVEAMIGAEAIGETPVKPIAEWANECHALGRSVYPEPGEMRLEKPYHDKNFPILERQLARAAVRLSRVLRSGLSR